MIDFQLRLYRLLHWLISLLPWCILDAISYIVAILLYVVVRYRRSVVEENLRRSFPDKSAKELRDLEWEFYQHLVMQFFTTPKILSQSPEVIQSEHLQLLGTEALQQDVLHGHKAIILLMGHCGNWEVFTAANLYLKPLGIQVEQLYRPLKNEAFNQLQLELRQRFGALTTPKTEVGRSIVRQMSSNNVNETRAIAFIADQTPSPAHIGLWTKFLNQDTPWLNGAERLAQKYALPVYYVDICRLTNRRYQGRFIQITQNGADCPKDEITQRFAELLEETIQRDPAIWLWSHKRWKHVQRN